MFDWLSSPYLPPPPPSLQVLICSRSLVKTVCTFVFSYLPLNIDEGYRLCHFTGSLLLLAHHKYVLVNPDLRQEHVSFSYLHRMVLFAHILLSVPQSCLLKSHIV